MHQLLCITVATLGIALAGCSKPEQPKTQLDPHETIYKEQIRALDKAKAVEGTIEQDAQHTREAVDKAEQGAR